MKHHHLEKIIHAKYFFLKSFVVSIIIMLLGFMFSTLLYPNLADLAAILYGIEAEDYGKIYISLFGLWKILIIQFTLIPAIVMAMIESHVRKYHKENKDC